MEKGKTKVLYCITKSNFGGAQKYVFDLTTSLPKDKYEAVVLMGGEGLLKTRLEEKNIRTIILPTLDRDVNFWKDIRSFFRLIKTFRQEKPGIIHLNSSKMGLMGGLAARIFSLGGKLRFTDYRPKIIFTGHGWAFNEDRSWWQKKIIYCLHCFTILLSTKTIAVSESTKQQIAKNGRLGEKIVIIRNGIGPVDFHSRENSRQEILKLLPDNLDLGDKVWLGTISELHKNKGLKYVIEAMHLLHISCIDEPQNMPVLIIIGYGEKRQKLQERIDRYKLNNFIFLVGKIDNAALYLKALDIFTLTSITEAFPYSILEAGQAGLPIIASAVGGIPEIIDDMADGILLKPKEPEEIMKAIEFLIKNPSKSVEFGHSIKTKINSGFTKGLMVKETLELYK
ncbi:MAG: glycosyltransferase [bacterium]